MFKMLSDFLRWWICTKIAPPQFVVIPVPLHQKMRTRAVLVHAKRNEDGVYEIDL